jgi:hypothetical protein
VAAGLQELRDAGPAGVARLAAAARASAEPFTFGAQVETLRHLYGQCAGNKAKLS